LVPPKCSKSKLHNLNRDETSPREKIPIHGNRVDGLASAPKPEARKGHPRYPQPAPIPEGRALQITHPEKSYEEHEVLWRNAETISKKLGCISHHLLCTGRPWVCIRKRRLECGCLQPTNTAKSLVFKLRGVSIPRPGRIRISPTAAGKSDFVHL